MVNASMRRVAALVAQLEADERALEEEVATVTAARGALRADLLRAARSVEATTGGALEAWKLAAEMMASKGKHAVISLCFVRCSLSRRLNAARSSYSFGTRSRRC